jgi:predicted RecA/RadA family phage recombinase
VSVKTRRGVFRFANSAAGDAIGRTEIGKTVYVVDDQTVAKTDNSGARPAAGKCFDVDANGVWVEFL